MGPSEQSASNVQAHNHLGSMQRRLEIFFQLLQPNVIMFSMGRTAKNKEISKLRRLLYAPWTLF